MAQASDPIASSSTGSSAYEDLPPLNRGDRNLNPPGISFAALLHEDLQTFDGNLFEPGFWAIALHRFGNWRMDIRPKLLRAALQFATQDADMVGRTGWRRSSAIHRPGGTAGADLASRGNRASRPIDWRRCAHSPWHDLWDCISRSIACDSNDRGSSRHWLRCVRAR